MPIHLKHFISSAFVFLTGTLLLAGCQATTTNSDFVSNADNASQIAVTEKIGPENGTKIALVLPLTGDQSAAAIKIRDGASKARNLLAKDDITLDIYDTKGSEERARTIAATIAQNRATKVVGLLGDRQILQSFSSPDAVALGFATNQSFRSPNVFPFLPSDVDSLASGIDYAHSQKPGPILLLSERGTSAARLDALKQAGQALGNTQIVLYDKDETSGSIARRAVDSEPEASVYGFLGNDKKLALIAKSLKSVRRANRNYSIVGNSSWTSQLYSDPALSGAIIAKLDTSLKDQLDIELGDSSDPVALYGFDLVAVTAGIIRIKGSASINRDAFLDPSGFKGVTGTFRFRGNTNTIERLFAVFKIEDKKMTLISSPSDGF